MNIPDDVFTKYKEAVDEMILKFGVNCRISYVKKIVQSGSQPITTTSKSLRPYDNTSSFLQNESYTEVETSDVVRLRVYWTKKDWKKIADLVIPDDGIMTIGYLSDLPKIRSCDYMIANIENLSFTNKKFTLATDTIPWGFKKDRYFVCGWSI